MYGHASCTAEGMRSSFTTLLGILTGVAFYALVAFISALVTSPAPAARSAAGGSTGPETMRAATGTGFEALDVDGDGTVSLAEAAGYREIVERFSRADADR